MEKLEIITHEKLPHIRYMAIDTLVNLKFNSKSQELTVSVVTTRSTASVQIENSIAVSELVHSARISDEGHVFPILKGVDHRIYISFDELKGYLAACKLCGIEPDSEVCENARAAETEL